MSEQGHAVVVGGSIAGLLAARVLSDHYARVTVLDRDRLPGEPNARKAVPQGHHIHALLGRGQQILEGLFPGFVGDLVAGGVPIGDFGTSLSWYFDGRMIRKTPTDMICVAAGRPRLEQEIRSRVAAIANVEIRDGVEVVEWTHTQDRNRITGVVALDPQAEPARTTLDADLVVDASGRGSRTPHRLEELGHTPPPSDVVGMDLTYTTCDFHGPLEYDPIGDDIALLPVATPAMPRGAIFARLPDRYAISLTGIRGDRPPTQMDEFLAYVDSLPVPEVAKSVRSATPMGAPMSFRFPASVRTRYDRAKTFPEGLIVLGDAFAIFNPVYGQGMTVAALAADLLAEHAARGPVQSKAFHQALSRRVEAPWRLAAGADLGFAGVEGKRTVATRVANAYISRLQRAAVKDPVLSRAFLRVAGLVDAPETLFRPDLVLRTLAA